MQIEMLLAFRYLGAGGKERLISIIGWFSLIGIILGVATLITVLAVMNGFRHKLLERILGVSSHLTVYMDPRGPIDNLQELLNRFTDVPGVTQATPIIEAQVLIAASGGATGALVRAMRPEDFAARRELSGQLYQGRVRDFGGTQTVFLGSRLARNLKVSLGDKVRLTAAPRDATDLRTPPARRLFWIGGILHTGMPEIDNRLIYMPMEPARKFFKPQQEANAIEIMIADPRAICRPGPARKEVACVMRRAITTATPRALTILDWKQANASFLSAIQIERNAMFLILGLVVLVAAFNIIASMVMLVNEKTTDIAILRTIGGSRGMVLRVFFIAGSAIGLTGTFLGFMFGVLLADNLGMILGLISNLLENSGATGDLLARMEGRIEGQELIAVLTMSLSLTITAALYPAWRAAKIHPIEGLR